VKTFSKFFAPLPVKVKRTDIIFERNETKFCLLNEMSGCPRGDFSAKLRKIFLVKCND
jgi:hypothetical protein